MPVAQHFDTNAIATSSSPKLSHDPPPTPARFSEYTILFGDLTVNRKHEGTHTQRLSTSIAGPKNRDYAELATGDVITDERYLAFNTNPKILQASQDLLEVRQTGLLGTAALLRPAKSQEFRASISGQVADTTCGAIANATITAVNVDTRVSSSTRTNQAGAYSLLDLIVPAKETTNKNSHFRVEIPAKGLAVIEIK